MVIICLKNELQTPIDLIKGKGFIFKRNRHYLAETMTDVDYTDDLALPRNTPAQA